MGERGWGMGKKLAAVQKCKSAGGLCKVGKVKRAKGGKGGTGERKGRQSRGLGWLLGGETGLG